MTQHSLQLLDYLPAIYRESPQLTDFLAPFEDDFNAVQELLDRLDRYWAPQATPKEFLPWLASWMALGLEADWTTSERRKLIAEAVRLYRWRGTAKGLRDYLNIFVDKMYEVSIIDPAWPAGMQIGDACRIGGFQAGQLAPSSICPDEPAFFDWYVVTETTAAGIAETFYRTDQVEQVANGGDTVTITLLPPEDKPAEAGPSVTHKKASIVRRDGIIDLCQVMIGDDDQQRVYRGHTALSSEIECPNSFIVELGEKNDRITQDQQNAVLEKVRNIVDQEKPAHAIYHLRVTRYEPKPPEPEPVRPFLKLTA
jgi:phage tail-like protein